jgi:hypothetical protein
MRLLKHVGYLICAVEKAILSVQVKVNELIRGAGWKTTLTERKYYRRRPMTSTIASHFFHYIQHITNHFEPPIAAHVASMRYPSRMSDSRRFQRRIESFTCLHCGATIHGDGYTNHCPHCLWSRHVDVNPGDRAAPCKGPMEPIAYEVKGGETVLLHRCATCRFERRNRTAPDDSLEAILALGNG